MKPVNQKAVEEFVDRLYRKVLDREPDAAGRTYHVSALMDRKTTPAQTGYGFYFGTEEMKTREVNEEFIPSYTGGCLGGNQRRQGRKAG